MISSGKRIEFLLLLLAVSSLAIVACSAHEILEKISAKIEAISGENATQAGTNDEKIFKSIIAINFGQLSKNEESFLKRFIALQKLSVKLCDSDGYGIVKGILAFMPSYSPEPIEDFTHRYVTKFARDCKEIWPRKYVEISTSSPKAKEVRENLGIAHAIFDAIEENDRIDKHALLGKFNGLRANDITGEANYQIVYDLMKLNTFGDANWPYLYGQMSSEQGLVTVDGRRIRKLLDKYFLVPCREYISLYGSNLFSPATFLLSFMKENERYKYDSHVDKEFVEAWRDFRLCGSALIRGSSIAEGLEQIARNTLP